MAKQTSNQRAGRRVTAIVSAYNEAPRLGAVLEVLSTYPDFDEIIVIDDGSTDGTSDVAKKFGVRVERNEKNLGKGRAMDRGVALANTEVIFFSDADITGLTHAHIDEIVGPVLASELDMFIGMTERKLYVMHEMLAFVPLLGGERAVTKTLWQKVPEYYKQHFRIEVALNFFAIYYGKGYQYEILNGVSQIIKEEKYGLRRGFWARLGMFYNLFSAQIRLNFRHTPQIVRQGRWLALLSLYGAAGTVLSAIIFIAIYFGPSEFVRYVFEEKLRDPTAEFTQLLWNFVNFTATDKIALIGLAIFVTSLSIFILTRKNLSYLLYGLVYKWRSGKRR